MKKSTRIALIAGGGLVLLVACLMALGIFWFQHDREQNLALDKAGTALNEQNCESAIALFDRALQLHLPPAKAASAYYGRAQAENAKAKYDDAIRDFSESIRLDPSGVEAYAGRGYAYQLKEEWEKALADYTEVLRSDQNAGWVYFNRGLIYLQRKEWAKAAEDFGEAIRCEPQYSYAYFRRGSALAELGDLDGALASLDAAILLQPRLAEAYEARAGVYRRRNAPERARSDELTAMQFAPRNIPSAAVSPLYRANRAGAELLDAARMAEMAGRYDEAIDLCDKALQNKLAPSFLSNAYMTRGNGYSGKGDWDRALRDYDEAVKIQPINYDALTNRGNAYARKGQRDKSTQDYNEAIRLNPKLFQAYCNRALNFLNAGDLDRALADLNESIRLNPKFAEAYSRRSVVLMRLKRQDDALADVDTAVTLMPDNPEAYFFRGRLRFARNEYSQARADFERVLERTRDPQSRVLNAVAWFFATCPDESARDGKKSVLLATKACELTQWKNASLLDTLAAAYAEAGDFDQAIKWQSETLKLYDDAGDSRSEMQKRLALYKQHKAYREGPKL
jgi:tetratricopeptide (TPR) repeat protein